MNERFTNTILKRAALILLALPVLAAREQPPAQKISADEPAASPSEAAASSSEAGEGAEQEVRRVHRAVIDLRSKRRRWLDGVTYIG